MPGSVFLTCPYCGERFEALVDTTAGDADYIEDCPVCYRPIEMRLHGSDDDFTLDAGRDS